MAERALLGPRRLVKEIPSYQGTHAVGVFPDDNGWLNSAFPNAVMYETYIDMSGLELDDLTFIPQAAVLQDPGRYACSGVPLVDTEVLDIISQERLTMADIDAQLNLGNVPGMSQTTEDFTQILFGQYRLLLRLNTSTNTAILSTVNGGEFGSQEATAASKLWCYRFVRLNNNPLVGGERLLIPASRFILVGTTVEEKELAYMMRLKRSYEIATQG